MRKRHLLRWTSVLAVTVYAAAVLAACGSSDDSSSSPSSSATGATTAANSTVSSTTAASGAEPTACKIGEKSIGLNEILAASIIEKRFNGAIEYAAKALGWEYRLLDAQANPAKALANMRAFADSGVDAIITDSLPAEWARPAAPLLKAKKIPTVNLITPATPGVYDGDVDEDAAPTSNALADQIIADYPNGAKIGIVYEGLIAAEMQRLAILKKRFKDAGNIKVVALHDQPVANQPGTAKSTVDMMNAHPEIEALLYVGSDLPRYGLQGLRQIRKTDVAVYSWYAESNNAKLIAANPNYKGVTDSDIVKAPFIALSELMKSFCGGKITPQQYVKADAVFITAAELAKRPSIAKDQGPVPYEEVAAPYFKQWKEMYGLGTGTPPPS